MQKPRLIYYNDAHHFHGKRIEPPVSIHILQWPVDEVAGTGVDLLVLGLGYGDVYFHNSKVGRVIGQKKEVWENYIDCHAHGGGGSETRYRSSARGHPAWQRAGAKGIPEPQGSRRGAAWGTAL
ncbi:MAG: hypothetical protein VX911_05480, partial [Candidatus Latescibacterota bacterium]|nr:hypothetical protein [Candidatus Latescibacterota bacterium]